MNNIIDKLEEKISTCPFCGGLDTMIRPGTQIWTGKRYTDPTHYELHHWCKDGSYIKLKAKTVKEVLDKWYKR